MSPAPVCPRCAGPLQAPGLMRSGWHCADHGAVAPVRVCRNVTAGALAAAGAASGVPVWTPLPLLPGWTVTGLATAGDDRTPHTAAAVCLSGPSPLGGPADLVLVAEEPGVGLGARLAGVDGPDPGIGSTGLPDAKLVAAGHPTPLWRCPSAPDRAAFLGEARGVWLYAVLWPPAAELVLLEEVELHDLRDAAHSPPELPIGAASTRLG